MKTAFYCALLALLVCSVAVAAEGPRNLERSSDRGKPLIVDGVTYDRSELEHFKDEPTMFWVLEREAIYGFSSAEGVAEYGREHARKELSGSRKSVTENTIIGPNCSGFNKNVGCGGVDWLPLCTPSQISYISDSWNDVISCVETGPSVGKWTVLYKCYYFSPTYPNCSHIVWITPGYTVPDLNPYGMNNLTSSIRFCSNVDPNSCT